MGWADELGPADALLLCDGAEHRVRYERGGRIALLDHPDLDAERAFGALGGEPPACVLLLQAWERLRTSLAVLHRWTPVDPPWSHLIRTQASTSLVGVRPDAPRARPFLPWIETAKGATGGIGELVRVGSVPGPLRERLGLLVLDHAFDQPPSTWVDGTTLAAALRRVACRFMRVAARHTMPDRPTPLVDVEEGDPAEAVVMGHADRLAARTTVWIGTDWLRDVLRRGAAVVDGLLCLAARDVPGEDAALDVLLSRWTWRPGLPAGELEPVCGWARATGTPATGWAIDRWLDEQAGA